MVKAGTMALKAVVPGIPKSVRDRHLLEKDLHRIGCHKFMEKPWGLWMEDMVVELLGDKDCRNPCKCLLFGTFLSMEENRTEAFNLALATVTMHQPHMGHTPCKVSPQHSCVTNPNSGTYPLSPLVYPLVDRGWLGADFYTCPRPS